MLNRRDLRVIEGGALRHAAPDEKFEGAYATDTRLMGVFVVYIKWQLTGLASARRKSRFLHQFYYIETTEEGIESYTGITGQDEEGMRFAEQSMLGGLGGGRVPLTMNEAIWLVQEYARQTKAFGKPLPDDTEDYAFVLAREAQMVPEREALLFRKLCGEVLGDYHLINYFLMRYFAGDYYPVDMLSAGSVPHDLLQGDGYATLCRNDIDLLEPVPGQDADERRYMCVSVTEEDPGHRIVVSEIGVSEDEEGDLIVTRLTVESAFSITGAEAAMKLSRPEFVTVYEVAGNVEDVIDELDNRYTGALQNLTEGGKLYISFFEDNKHVNQKRYLLNDDVKEIVYLTVEDQLIVGSYSLAGIKRIENRMLLSRFARQLIEVGKYEFKEPMLYDYTMSYGGDFVRYVEEIMGFEDDGDDR
ncbi:MAG: hypothetical protein LBN12_08470 [Clostridiales Family XIII bacterium]|jgi:hypothetical protein|nr:hypothetical protein [Clostridiales Family XIII bacterium]